MWSRGRVAEPRSQGRARAAPAVAAVCRTKVPTTALATLLLSLACLLVQPRVSGAPYTPGAADKVLERLPAYMTGAAMTEIQALHQQLAAQPGAVAVAARLAGLYLDKGRTESDPRYFGYAQAALSPWWQVPDAPIPVRLLRAEIEQWRHEFDAAIAELRAVVTRDNRNARAWLMLANTYLVQGQAVKAAAACSALAKVAHSSGATLCYAGVMNRTGRAAQAYELLRVAALQFGQQPSATLQWIFTAQAQAALMLGRRAQAEAAFTKALSIAHRDAFLLAAYADFLLAEGREAQVLILLKEETRDQTLLLRAAIAAANIGDQPLTETYRSQLRARFDAEQRRGSQLHYREAALFELKLGGDVQQALHLAIANWAVQKEPLDARILLQAALAAGDAKTVNELKTWLASSGLQDVRLAALLKVKVKG